MINLLILLMELRGIEPQVQPSDSIDSDATESVQIRTNTKQINALSDSTSAAEKQSRTSPEHPNDTSLHEKCATCVHQAETFVPNDLHEVIEAWAYIPNAVKQGIVAMVQAARQDSSNDHTPGKRSDAPW